MPDRDNDLDSEEAREKYTTATVLTHGIRSWGIGFQKLAETLRSSNSFPNDKHLLKMYEYKKITAISAFTPGTKKLITDALGYYLNKIESSYGGNKTKYPNIDTINAISHSFSSYGITNYLLNADSDEIYIDNLILVGSVVDRNYPWTKVIHEENKVGNVYNVISNWDMVPELARLAGLGNSGSAWFKSDPGFTDLAVKDGEAHVENLVWNGIHTSYSSPSWAFALAYLLQDRCYNV